MAKATFGHERRHGDACKQGGKSKNGSVLYATRQWTEIELCLRVFCGGATKFE